MVAPECSAILSGLSALGASVIICLIIIMIVLTALLINLILRKYWKPVKIIHYVDIPVSYDATSGKAILVGIDKAEKKLKS